MTNNHCYTTKHFYAKGIPISKLEFEEGTDAQAAFTETQAVFLKDAHIQGFDGKVTAVPYLVLHQHELTATPSADATDDYHYHLAINKYPDLM